MRVAVFPGSFDPVTRGHEDIARKALHWCDKLIIAVGINTTKVPMFPAHVRMQMWHAVVGDHPRIAIVAYNGLTIDLCRSMQASYIVRGVRDGLDLSFELSIAHMNADMDSAIQTIFLPPTPTLAHIRAVVVREIWTNRGDVRPFVSDAVFDIMRKFSTWQ